nr:transcription factor DREB11 [Larix gmelinii var. olgensis x Larix kaempferi]
MEKPTPQEHDNALADEGRGQTSRQLKGVRLRKWGKWVSEIRMPKSRAKIWLGSYKTPEQAARAYDAALYCLKGPTANFNFPDSVPLISPASSRSRQQIKDAAAKYARGELPSASPSLHNNSMEEPALPSPLQSFSVSEMELSSELWQSLFPGTDGSGCHYLDNFPSIDEASASDLYPTLRESYTSVDPTELWNFGED